MMVKNGILIGSEGSTAAYVFWAAGIDYTLSEAPVARQLEMIAKDQAPSCAVGYYWTADRARSGKYTLPIFRSQPQDLVIRADNPKVQSYHSLVALLADPSVNLVLRNGNSYGPSVDALLLRAKARIKRPPENSHGRLKMVLAGMEDGTLFTREEAELQIQQFGDEGKALQVKHFSDTPPGEPSYLYCSNSVGDALINKVNEALKKRH